MLRRALAVVVFLAATTILWPFWANLAFAQSPEDGGDQPKELRTDMGRKMARELMCQCGCGLTVASCRDSMTCTTASGLVEQIERQVAAGKSEAEIRDYFVSVYGEQILALPSKSGFNITAWTIPFVAVAAGALSLGAFTFAWVRRRSSGRLQMEPALETPGLSSYEERVDQDMELME